MEAKENYSTVKPKNKILQKYIAYYYFNDSDDATYLKQFIFYPHYRNSLTVYKNSEVSFIGNQSVVFPTQNTTLTKTYTGVHLQSRVGKMQAPFNKIGIVFQALGINNFLAEPLSSIVQVSPKSDFDYFGKALETTLIDVYNANNVDEKIDILDAFFINKLNPMEDTRLEEAITLMFKGNFNIQEIASSLKINRKTLLRLFKKHVNCTPKEYASVIKFRDALNLYQNAQKELAFTALAYNNNYYDQSDFIKHFRRITGFNPKKFFENISHFGNEDTFWTLLK